MLLLLHQALPGPVTNNTALNKVKVKMVFCLGFKVPLLQYPSFNIHPSMWPGDAGSELLTCYSGFLPHFTLLLNHVCLSVQLCVVSFLPLPLCDSFCCSNCHNVAVWGFTCTFACRLSPHLEAILPGLGNLSCGWLPREQMFLMPLVEEKSFESDSIKDMPAA